MPQPTRTQVHIDTALTNISIAFLENQRRFVANQIFPTVRVAKQSDKYFTYPRAEWLRTDAAVRGPGAESVGSGYTQSTDSYFCDVYALHKDVDDQTRRNADVPLNIDRDAANYVAGGLALKREIVFSDAIMSTSVWNADTTPSPKWDDVSSDPVGDVSKRFNVMVENTGYMPNTLVLGAEVFRALREHPDILDRIKYTQTGIVTQDLLAAVFNVDRVLVLWATRNSAAEQATASMDFVADSGKTALLCYSNPSPGILSPSAGYTFEWSPLMMSRFRIEERKSDRIEGEMAFDFKVVSSVLGEYFSSAVT